MQRVRKAKDRKIIMGFKTKEDQKKVRERLQEGNHLVVEELKNKDPLLLLRDVLTINANDAVLRALRNRNGSVFRDLDHIVMSTSPTKWKTALELEALHVDLQRIKVADQSPLVQCTRFLAYGHSKRFCRESMDLSSPCGGK